MTHILYIEFENDFWLCMWPSCWLYNCIFIMIVSTVRDMHHLIPISSEVNLLLYALNSSPTVHICAHSAHASFIVAPPPHHIKFCSSGARLGGASTHAETSPIPTTTTNPALLLMVFVTPRNQAFGGRLVLQILPIILFDYSWVTTYCSKDTCLLFFFTNQLFQHYWYPKPQ